MIDHNKSNNKTMDDDNQQWESFINSLLDDDYDVRDSDSFRRLGEGPAVKSLPWPTPTICHAELISGTVKAYDHRSRSVRTLQNVLVKKRRNDDEPPDKAYLIRRRICKTKFGSVRMGLVLRRRDDQDDAEEDVDEVPWISTEELVALKVSSWNKIRQSKGKQQHQHQQLHQQQLEDPLREVAAMQLVGNSYPHIVGCYEVLQDSKHLYAVMPYFSQGTNLHTRLFSSVHYHQQHEVTPNEEEARVIFRQLLRGLLQLQQKGIFHGDLSLDNLLISKSNQLKIVDLGMSLRVPYNDPCNDYYGCITDVSEGRVRRLIKKQQPPRGTTTTTTTTTWGGEMMTTTKLMYSAPEILSEQQDSFDGYAVDLWAAGVILFVLCVGLAPFKFADHSDKRYSKISSGGLSSLMKTLKIGLSPEACDLIQKMMYEKPRKRLSLMEVMRHPWVMGETFDVVNVDPVTEEEEEHLPIISRKVSHGSVSSTEPTTQEADCDPLKTSAAAPPPSTELLKPRQPSSSESPIILGGGDDDDDDVTRLHPETREESVSEEDSSSRDNNSFAENVHQVPQRLAKNLQLIGPRIINFFEGSATSQPPPPSSSSSQPSTTTPTSSPTRSSRQTPTTPQIIFRRLKTVLPHNNNNNSSSSSSSSSSKTMSSPAPPRKTTTATATA